MATQNECVPWACLHIEELVRILDIHNSESKERREKFQEKLDSLKERQEELQQRSVSRLRNEGIHIDFESVKRRAKAPRGSKWFDSDVAGEIRRKIMKDKLKELLKPRDAVAEDETDFDYESESEYDIDAEYGDRVSRRKSLSRGPSREPTKLDKISEEETLAVSDAEKSTHGKVKTVQVRVKKLGSKRTVKAVGHIVSTTKFLSKVSRKNAKSNSIDNTKSEERISFAKKKSVDTASTSSLKNKSEITTPRYGAK